ncbi:N-acyl-phosphatidylethanolamine-hydrolyzing phospholipase D [Lachnellula occidentalis]|uniref:N-acyl-phosphatidylethanolamine-hydrolyzing phospholipase D n=1 Tax=Lachnellula occidentalis TaxID=215460 RepID=A0A8H8U5B3_9HELO|nr:N-acyl-phosphatidylethanolamine-hydrolyzing phospholipase D [Lachnellula occidentalis]
MSKPKTWPPWSTTSTKPARPSHHANSQGTAFKNPWPSADPPNWTELLQTKFPLEWYEDLSKKHPGTRDVKVVVPDWGASTLQKRGLARDKCIVATALGHAGVITEQSLEGGKSFYVVYDPIFSPRAGPTQYTGPQRLRGSPCQVTDLPGCDAVMISHNHYDHLDLPTIQAILKKFPEARYFVPLGNKSWLCAQGISSDRVTELDWWQSRNFSAQDFGHPPAVSAEETLRFTCVPAQHNSGRGALDQGATLWCGWVVEQLIGSKDDATLAKAKRKSAIYHAGDTGYRRSASSPAICPIFKEIGESLGPFDVSFVPIWRGGSLGFISRLGLRLSHDAVPSALHASPGDALDIHGEVRSRNTIAIHFGSFVGSENESLEAVLEFEEERGERGVLELEEGEDTGKGRAGMVDIGGSFAVEVGVEKS